MVVKEQRVVEGRVLVEATGTGDGQSESFVASGKRECADYLVSPIAVTWVSRRKWEIAPQRPRPALVITEP